MENVVSEQEPRTPKRRSTGSYKDDDYYTGLELALIIVTLVLAHSASFITISTTFERTVRPEVRS